jgi:two-component system NarL family sensor kinase
MFLSKQEFILVISVASLLPLLFSAFVGYLLYRQNNQRKQHQIEVLDVMLRSQEAERKRIAEDLHDQIGGALTGIKFQLSFDDKAPDEKKSVIIQHARSDLNSTILQLRTISHELYPEHLNKSGLTNALNEVIGKYNQSGKAINFSQNLIDESIPLHYQSNLYKICLELINNSVKHSNCSEINISFFQNTDTLTLNYRDNGNMNSSSSIDAGIGMQNVKNRVLLLRGKILRESIDFSTGANYEFRFAII